jgi:hypothetical protein
VEFSPTLKQLATVVGNMFNHFTKAVSDIPRLPNVLTHKKSNREVMMMMVMMMMMMMIDDDDDDDD